MQDDWIKSQVRSFLAGGLGGICLVLVGHPFDLVKVRVQTGTSTALHVLKDILKTNGPRGLYRGVTAPLIGVTPIFAICFWGYDLGLSLYDSHINQIKDMKDDGGYKKIMFAGGFSALPTTLIMAPSERIKVVMQTSHMSLRGAVSSVWSQGGLTSLFRGSMATLARDIPGSVAYFGVYEAAKKALSTGTGVSTSVSTGGVLLAGGLAGMANWAVAIPADVVKSRLQAGSGSSGALGILRTMLREEGVGSLFRGLGPVMLRAFPANAACFLGMETGKKLLSP